MSKQLPQSKQRFYIRPFSLHHEKFAKRTATKAGTRERNAPRFEKSFILVVRLEHEDLMYGELYAVFEQQKTIELWECTPKKEKACYYQGKIAEWRKTREGREIVEIELVVETTSAGIEIEANTI